MASGNEANQSRVERGYVDLKGESDTESNPSSDTKSGQECKELDRKSETIVVASVFYQTGCGVVQHRKTPKNAEKRTKMPQRTKILFKVHNPSSQQILAEQRQNAGKRRQHGNQCDELLMGRRQVKFDSEDPVDPATSNGLSTLFNLKLLVIAR
ncbi:hypothetical protein R3P38DRAFT_2776827 [Favolaschia claudopus]|uniref:Uncharacterized protein n=1 Tax=Favolaschia claudopus TaxID=2862362 RepID=A0AAW0BMN0_9AGAR